MVMRKGFLACVSVALLIGSTAWGSGTADDASDARTTTTVATAGKYHEAPMLAALVAQGKLPPVEDRLPNQPRIIRSIEVGRYGGTLNVAATGDNVWQDAQPASMNSFLFELEESGEIAGSLATRFEVSDDSKTITIHLREGAKWSDGAPFTADDILFMLVDMHKSEDVNTGFWATWSNLMSEVEKLDDLTLRIHLHEPEVNPFLFLTSYTGGEYVMYAPQHYLQKWHAKYNVDAAALAKQEGHESWGQALWYHADIAGLKDLELPKMAPWIPTRAETTVHTFERNPFYWQVDTGNNQLPYIDSVVATVVDSESYNLRIISGEVDVAYLYTSFENFSLYKENEANGDYTVHLIQGNFGSEAAFSIHQTIDDPVLRELFRDLRFRRALSLAIDRDEINEVVYWGQGIPRQATILPSASFYKEEWAQHFVEYDPERANALLDEIGLTTRAADGYRVGADGETILLLIEVSPASTEMATVELVKAYWEEVGLKTEIKPEEGGFLQQRALAPDHAIIPSRLFVSEELMMFMRAGLLGGIELWQWDTFWREWLEANDAIRRGEKTLSDYGGDMPGEEPPDDMKQFWNWRQDWRKNTRYGSPEYIEMAQKIFDFYSDNLILIGTVGLLPHPYIAKNSVGNVPARYQPNFAGWPGDLNYFAHHLYFKN